MRQLQELTPALNMLGGSAAGFGGMIKAGEGLMSGGMEKGQFQMNPMVQHFQQQPMQPPFQMQPGMYMQQQMQHPQGNTNYDAAYQSMCNPYQQQYPHLGQGQQHNLYSRNGQQQEHFSGNGNGQQ